MCENRGEKFVVPTKPTSWGWWYGEVIGTNGRFYEIALLWVQFPEHQCAGTVHSTEDYIKEFDTLPEAILHLKSMGLSMSASA